jgi:predicted HTH domain antitoxin
MKLVMDVPDGAALAEKMEAKEFAMHLRVLAAMKLYELGRFSSGRAAELAGMTRVEFLSRAGAYQVFPLAAELNDLENSRAS